MARSFGRLLGLCLPPALLAAADGTTTLAGQSAAYWRGNYSDVNELSPTFHQLLAAHPAAFAAGLAAWVLLVTCLILLSSQTLALATSIAVTLGHCWGLSTWLLHRFDYGYQGVCGMLVLTGLLLATSIRWGWGAAPPPDESPAFVRRMPAAVRWLVIAAALGAVVYLFLWPRTAP